MRPCGFSNPVGKAVNGKHTIWNPPHTHTSLTICSPGHKDDLLMIVSLLPLKGQGGESSFPVGLVLIIASVRRKGSYPHHSGMFFPLGLRVIFTTFGSFL